MIVASDRRSFEHLALRFPEEPAGSFFREMAAGEAEALRLLAGFARAVGLGEHVAGLPGGEVGDARLGLILQVWIV